MSEATTSEADGLRVLWNGPVHGTSTSSAGWAAAGPDEMAELWKRAGVPAPVPRVSFEREVVLAVVGGGGVCPGEITGVRLETGGVLRLQETPDSGSCIDVLTRVAEVVAVPRRLLGRRVTLVSTLSQGVFQFAVPVATVKDSPDALAPPSPRGTLLGEVHVPERGHMALARLLDGSEVWVVHHRDGDIDVLSSSVATRDTNYFELAGDLERALYLAPAWDERTGRFLGGYDAHGRSVHGWAPMPSYRFSSAGAATLSVEGVAPRSPGPIERREAAPRLDGPASPYSERNAVADFDAIAPGHFELLDADVVFGMAGQARLCRAPPSGPASAQFAGCPETAPVIASSVSRRRRGVMVLDGPFIVRRLGVRSAEVVVVRPLNQRVIVPRE